MFSWVGDIGVFARGTTQADLNGALVISTTDDAKAEAAFGKLVGLIGKQSGTKVEPIQLDGAEAAFAVPAPGAPQQVILARGEGRVVAAFGEQAAKDALSPSAKLGDSESFGDAKDVLGDFSPSFVLAMDPIVKLVDATGDTDADWEQAKPYLAAIGVITSGGKADGDRVQSRVAVTLK